MKTQCIRRGCMTPYTSSVRSAEHLAMEVTVHSDPLLKYKHISHVFTVLSQEYFELYKGCLKKSMISKDSFFFFPRKVVMLSNRVLAYFAEQH